MYEILIINWGKKAQEKISIEEYQNFVQQHAYKKYAKTFSEVMQIVGGRPYRQRAGYSAFNGNIEYIITKC